MIMFSGANDGSHSLLKCCLNNVAGVKFFQCGARITRPQGGLFPIPQGSPSPAPLFSPSLFFFRSSGGRCPWC